MRRPEPIRIVLSTLLEDSRRGKTKGAKVTRSARAAIVALEARYSRPFSNVVSFHDEVWRPDEDYDIDESVGFYVMFVTSKIVTI